MIINNYYTINHTICEILDKIANFAWQLFGFCMNFASQTIGYASISLWTVNIYYVSEEPNSRRTCVITYSTEVDRNSVAATVCAFDHQIYRPFILCL